MKKLDISNAIVSLRRVSTKLKNYLDSRYIIVPQPMVIIEDINSDTKQLKYRALREIELGDDFFYGMSLLYCNEENEEEFNSLPKNSEVKYDSFIRHDLNTLDFDDPESYINKGRCFMVFKTQKEFLKYKIKN